MSAVEGRAEVVNGAANRRDWPAADLGSHFEMGRRLERSRDHARPGEAAGCALEASGSLSVSLTAEPSDTTISVHPVVDIGLAAKAGDFSGFSARVLSHDNPVVVRVTDRSEDHFCFCHAALSRHLSQKRIPRCHGEAASIIAVGAHTDERPAARSMWPCEAHPHQGAIEVSRTDPLLGQRLFAGVVLLLGRTKLWRGRDS